MNKNVACVQVMPTMMTLLLNLCDYLIKDTRYELGSKLTFRLACDARDSNEIKSIKDSVKPSVYAALPMHRKIF